MDNPPLEQKITPTIIYKNVKHANIKIKPTKEVTLTVPLGMSIKAIEEILRAKTKWIKKHLNSIGARQQTPAPPKKELIDGENFIYLGKTYLLKVIESDQEQARLTQEHLTLYLADKNNYAKKEQLIHDWYRNQAKEHFTQVINKYSPIVNIPIKAVRIRSMKTRWGSCNSRKAYINLNLELMKQDKQAIEYVVFHELAHLIHPNHSKHFYGYIAKYMPDWKERRDRLSI